MESGEGSGNTNYGDWSLAELKGELRKRKARISGRKHDLVER